MISNEKNAVNVIHQEEVKSLLFLFLSELRWLPFVLTLQPYRQENKLITAELLKMKLQYFKYRISYFPLRSYLLENQSILQLSISNILFIRIPGVSKRRVDQVLNLWTLSWEILTTTIR